MPNARALRCCKAERTLTSRQTRERCAAAKQIAHSPHSKGDRTSPHLSSQSAIALSPQQDKGDRILPSCLKAIALSPQQDKGARILSSSITREALAIPKGIASHHPPKCARILTRSKMRLHLSHLNAKQRAHPSPNLKRVKLS
jgi:hypothetical protein